MIYHFIEKRDKMMHKESGNTLYLECYSGISGDMVVGTLLDLGASQEILEEQLKSLPIGGFRIQISRVKKSGLDACDFHVILDKQHENHDHDNEYLYAQEGREHGAHVHMHEEHTHMHSHEHEYGHEEHVHMHSHEHRGLPEIQDIISRSCISDRAKQMASDIFRILAEAESKAHGIPLEEVHFHEVGAVDSIVDIVAAAVCLDNLNITEMIVQELYEGRGTVRCQHGIIPVPVPAVVNIIGPYDISLHMTETEAELVTPTGAAIVAALRTSDRLPDRYKIQKTGMGAGKRDYGRTSILRGMLIEPEAGEADGICKLESNIDDVTGEVLGYVMEQLFEAGARDVYYTPIYMKKNRPAYQLNVICDERLVPEMENIIFCETTTIGIRRVRMQRTRMCREIHQVETSLGMAEVKVCKSGELVRIYPEYESIASLGRESGLSYREVWSRVCAEAEEKVRETHGFANVWRGAE